jgi:Major Facilitator Superfamily
MNELSDPAETNPPESLEPLHQLVVVPGYATVNSDRRWSVGTLSYGKAGLAVLFSLLLWGDFAWSMKDRSAGPIIQIVIRAFHASNREMQMFTVVIPSAIGMILGPIVSFRSDRHRGRWGRRIPYLLVSTPFAVAAMVALGYSPAMGASLDHLLGEHSPGLERCTRFLFGVFWVIFEVATVTANSVFGGLINDVVPRPLLGRFYGLFRAFSLIAGMLFNWELLGLSKEHFKAMFIGIGLLYGIGFTFMCLTVCEGKYPPPPETPEELKAGFFHDAAIYLRECFSNPYYVWVMLALTLNALAFLPVNNFTQPFAESLKLSSNSNDTLGKYLAITYAFSFILSYSLGSLADRFHPLRMGIFVMILYAAVTLWGEFYSGRSNVLFTLSYHFRGHPEAVPIHLFAIALIAHGVLSGTFFTCTASLGQQLFPRGLFAQFSSAAQVIVSISQIAVGYLTGLYFDRAGQVYHHTYGMGLILAVAATVVMLIVHQQFMRYGGPKHYVAP